ncbi:MAG: GTP cyclohydrolase FolE2 [Brevinematales bacterium]|nr:GTP cyclohydrolase FolE2 [Brevinematales bacterium]
MKPLKDVQSEKDIRGKDIDKVGIRGLKYPISLLDKNNKVQHTIADIDMYVFLPRDYRGTHMSRFIEVINDYRREISIEKIEPILRDLKLKLHSRKAEISLRFPYFIEKLSPISRNYGMNYYEITFDATCDEKYDFVLTVSATGMSLCPCSKEISKNNAHNQRVSVSVSVRMSKIVWIEEIVDVIEGNVSSPVYVLLKREDEKFVTEQSYENPKFVEDIVRDISIELDKNSKITWYSIEAESYESIHPFNAYAYIEKQI